MKANTNIIIESAFDSLKKQVAKATEQYNACLTAKQTFSLKPVQISLMIKLAIDCNAINMLASLPFSAMFFVEGESNLHFAAEKRLEQLQKSEKGFQLKTLMIKDNLVVELGISQNGNATGYLYSVGKFDDIQNFPIEQKIVYNFAVDNTAKIEKKQVGLVALANIKFAIKELKKDGFQVL